MTISVIVPTVGRDTLGRALRSAMGADEIIVVPNQDGDLGYRARNEGMARATGTHLAFLDDDDVYTPGALDVMREHACDRPCIFQMEYGAGGVLWNEVRKEVRHGFVGTPMILVPNDPARLGRWEAHHGSGGGDYVFLRGCVEKMGQPKWVPHVVALIRPSE